MCRKIRGGGRVGSVALYGAVMRWLKQIVSGLGGQSEVEGCALALDAGGPDTSAMLIDDAATDGKPETGSTHGARVRRVALPEAIEDVLELVCGNTAALVADLDQRFAVVQITRGEVNLAARWRELDRVREQVVERLQNAVGISPDVDAVRGEEDPDVGSRRAGLLHAGSPAQQIFRAAHGRMKFGLAARDALQVENVIDQTHQPVRVADCDFEHLLRLLRPIRQRSAGQQTKRSSQRS